jgi:asparagine synthase (glutamine-hydrolysing)
MGMANAWLRRRGRIGIAAHALAEPRRGARWLRWFQNDAVPEPIIAALVGEGAEPDRALSWVEGRVGSYPQAWSDLQRMQMLDLESWLPNNLLHRGDYTTMQASLEQRVPFLDAELTPWAVALPDRMKIKGVTGKLALRGAFASHVPRQVLERPKSGFRLPLGEWLAGKTAVRAMIHDHLLNPNAFVAGLLGRREIEDMLSPRKLGTTGGAKLAWTTLCLELWLASIGRPAFHAERHQASQGSEMKSRTHSMS